MEVFGVNMDDELTRYIPKVLMQSQKWGGVGATNALLLAVLYEMESDQSDAYDQIKSKTGLDKREANKSLKILQSHGFIDLEFVKNGFIFSINKSKVDEFIKIRALFWNGRDVDPHGNPAYYKAIDEEWSEYIKKNS